MTPLPVLQVLREAFVLPWTLRSHYVGLMIVPALFSVLLVVTEARFLGSANSQTVMQAFGWIAVSILWLVPYTIFAISCHRIPLLGVDSNPWFGVCVWTRRETRFIWWLIGVNCLAALLTFPLTWITNLFLGQDLITMPPTEYYYLHALPMLYVLGRCIFVLPATAIDLTPTLASAWRQSRGNGWRLAIVLGVLPFLHTIEWITTMILFGDSHWLIWEIAMVPIYYTVVGIEVTGLSLSYRHLSAGNNKGVPTDPI